jgi:hypothetical protein
MKQRNLTETEQILLRKRAVIETVNDELKNICKLQHTSSGFLFNVMATLSAYSFFPKKPSLNIQMETSSQLCLAA